MNEAEIAEVQSELFRTEEDIARKERSIADIEAELKSVQLGTSSSQVEFLVEKNAKTSAELSAALEKVREYEENELTSKEKVCKIYWSLSISRRTYGFALVRPCVLLARRDIWRSAHQIFLKLGTKLHLGETKKMFQADF